MRKRRQNFRKYKKLILNRREFKSIRDHLHLHVKTLSREIGPRNSLHYPALTKAYRYIEQQMSKFNSELSIQDYHHEKKNYHNLILEFMGNELPDEIIVVGAHYDTVMNSPGADDNASGIACLLELIRLLHHYPNKRTLRFAAFTLEEPPFFGTEQMGSYVYARSCRNKNENIACMIALEMLGYYTEKRHSQKHPFPHANQQYPDKGNFIALISNERSRHLNKTFAGYVKETSLIEAHPYTPISYSPEIELSDHASFWKNDYPAFMITDTAFFRNPNYHEINDNIETINFRYFTRTVFSLIHAIKRFDQQDSIQT
ncbi:M28 family peptidase [candidate division KSB1 bacterium]|nr:M28 family peptidase [candidate division KSB1 bacterium]